MLWFCKANVHTEFILYNTRTDYLDDHIENSLHNREYIFFDDIAKN